MSQKNKKNPCVVCGGLEDRLLFVGPGFDRPEELYEVRICGGCGLVRTELEGVRLHEHYDGAYYGSGTEKKFSGPIETLVRRENEKRADFLLSFLPEAGASGFNILDVGCGRGNFLKTLQSRGHDCVGTEMETFPVGPSSERLQFLQGNIETLPLAPGSFDAVSIWHVFEHVQNPSTTMARLAEVLKPGGALMVAVPNSGSFQAGIFGKYWFHLDLPRHTFHFTPEILDRLFQAHGLNTLKRRTWALDQNVYGFIQSTLNWLFPRSPNQLYSLLKRRPSGEQALKQWLVFGLHAALAGLLLPVALLESALSAIFGKGASLIVVARKEA